MALWRLGIASGSKKSQQKSATMYITNMFVTCREFGNHLVFLLTRILPDVRFFGSAAFRSSWSTHCQESIVIYTKHQLIRQTASSECACMQGEVYSHLLCAIPAQQSRNAHGAENWKTYKVDSIMEQASSRRMSRPALIRHRQSSRVSSGV